MLKHINHSHSRNNLIENAEKAGGLKNFYGTENPLYVKCSALIVFIYHANNIVKHLTASYVKISSLCVVSYDLKRNKRAIIEGVTSGT